MTRVGVVGYGYWGPNLVRNFSEIPGAEVEAVSDLNRERLAQVEARYPAIRTTTKFQDLLESPTIEAVAIATPVSTHYELAMAALKAGKHVLVEKPMTATSEQGEKLVEEAERSGRVLMVDHTFIYTSAVRKIKDLVDRGELGDLYYYDSTRINLGLFQHDVSVIWDLAVHDLAIMDYVLPSQPMAVSTTGMSHVSGKPENIAYLTLYYEDRMIAHLHVNWLAPLKIRRTLVGGSRKMVVYDDLEPSEKVKVYDKGITVDGNTEKVYGAMIGYRAGDMWAPQLDATETLRTELTHFVECVREGKRPITDGAAGLRVVRILEAATWSMVEQGRSVDLSSFGNVPRSEILEEEAVLNIVEKNGAGV